jgi:oligoendopeptidase F
LEKVYTFAHLRNDEDKTNSHHQGNYETVTRLLTQTQQARSFINAEIMAIPDETMQGFLNHPELELYRLHLERQLRYRSHTLSEKEEALLAASSEMARAPQDAFGMLDNADLKLGTVKDEHGKEIAITQGNLQSLLQKYDRRVRQETFETFYKAYEDHKFTYSTLLSASIKKDIFYAQARNYPPFAQ